MAKAPRKTNQMPVVVGCCGFAVPGGMKSYYKEFNLVEIQSTFYNIPRLETVSKWRADTPATFEFVPKAFQGITHPTSSPTWRRFRGRLPLDDKDTSGYGFLRPTDEVIRCWNIMIEICSRLRSEAILVQTPPNFECSKPNMRNMEALLTTVKRSHLQICWEPRGDWNQNPNKIREICSRLDLIHVTDIMRREPMSENITKYARLHGLNTREFDYKYMYNSEELRTLRERILKLAENSRKVYVLFNNSNMATDAREFSRILQEKT